MKYLFINSVAGYGSTGKIALKQCEELETQGHKCVLAFGRVKTNCGSVQTYQIGTKLDYCIHGLITRLFDAHGFGSKRATKKFLKWVDSYNPDVVWLHNIHGYYINFVYLFEWMKRHPDKKYYWTLHDCWAMTGHCSHFSYVGCSQWKTKCGHKKCLQVDQYPKSLFSRRVTYNYIKKKKVFSDVPNMRIIVPSKWLAQVVESSFLNQYKIKIVPNKINEKIFIPRKSDFRARYDLCEKIVLLGVSSIWNERKGLDDFYELRRRLPSKFAIVLVGLSKVQLSNLPNGIIGIGEVSNSETLAEIYSAADCFINPSKEETFSLTTAEAIACGTFTIVYKGTACEELIRHARGIAVEDLADICNYLAELY